MKLRLALVLLTGLAALPLMAQTITVGFQQQIEIRVAGATAAYSVNSFYADASANDGVVTVQGNRPGTTTIMVITGAGIQSFRVSIPEPRPQYPPGFEPPANRDQRYQQDGSYEARLTNNPYQLQNLIDFSSREPDRTVRFHAVNADILEQNTGTASAVTLPFLSYEIDTPRRDVTFVDQMVKNSPLTLDDVALRGFHLREGNWIFHGGYTSQAQYQNFFLPTQQEVAVGVGYRFPLGDHSSLTPNLYYMDANSSVATTAHSGVVGSLVFRHDVGTRLRMLAETGVGGGVGVAGRLQFHGASDELRSNLRYEPDSFHSVSVNNLHGLLSDFSWGRKINRKLHSDLTFSGNRYELPNVSPSTNISSSALFEYQLVKRWSVTAGSSYAGFSGGTSQSGSSASQAGSSSTGNDISTWQLPIGVNFGARHFGAGFQYEATHSSQGGGWTPNFRGNVNIVVNSRWQLSGYVSRQTNVPTLAGLISSVPGLQDTLNRLGLSVTSLQQLSELLATDANLVSLGLVNNLSLNLSPVLLQAGGTVSWTPTSTAKQQFYFSVLYDNNQMPSGNLRSTIYSATYSRKLNRTNTFFGSYSLYRTQSPGTPAASQPVLELSLRHAFNTVPKLLMPGRKGTISGTVFHDLQLEGVFHEGMPPMAGVEVLLDGTHKTTTDAAGHYSFARVPFGPHRLQVAFSADRPFYFTTQSEVTAEIDTAVNFGIAFSRARLIGHVLNDAGIPVAGVKVGVFGAERTYSAETDSGGSFMIADLEAGTFRAEINPESLPMGYVSEGLEPVAGELPVGSPIHITFRLKAIRAVAGKVTIFDSAQRRDVPVPGVTVRVLETGAESITDKDGNYLFRQMPAGTFTLAISYQGKDFKLSVSLPPAPVFSRNNDFGLGRR
jgi:hypothetical protein